MFHNYLSHYLEDAASLSVEQEGFRWRNDDGSETTATWRQSQDVNDSVKKLTNIRLRVLLNATGDPATTAYKLQFKKTSDGDETYANIPTSAGSAFIISASSNIAVGGEITTFQLSAPATKSTTDFDTGRMWDDENGTDTIDITLDNYTELEWCFQATSTSLSVSYSFRIVDGSDAVISTYTVTPQLTILSGFIPKIIIM